MDHFLEHSYKGTSWKNHKYLYKKNGKYVYDADESRWEDAETGEEITGKELDKIVMTQELVDKGRNFFDKLSDFVRPDIFEYGPMLRDVIDYFAGRPSWFDDPKGSMARLKEAEKNYRPNH